MLGCDGNGKYGLLKPLPLEYRFDRSLRTGGLTSWLQYQPASADSRIKGLTRLRDELDRIVKSCKISSAAACGVIGALATAR